VPVADGVTTYYDYNAGNELTKEWTLGGDSVYYDYDARGNCTQREVLGGDTTYYTYNSRNLLTSVSSTESGSVATYYQYNAFDERIHEIKADGTGEKRTICVIA
jgi:YD repeat-containing protein